MAYVEQNLMQGEKLYVQAQLHWTIFTKAIIFTLLAIGLLIYSMIASLGGKSEIALIARNVGLVLLLPGLWNTFDAFIKRQSTELAVTSKRVIAKFGFIRCSTIELNHSKVESFHVEQGVLGRLFGFGTLHINGTGGGITPIPNISDPLGFRRKAMEAIDASQNRS
ncbi:MAG: PH domain-containing protein [Chlorobium sp.]|nr:MAG: PH domain-containing protein [Chlorobium sp.]